MSVRVLCFLLLSVALFKYQVMQIAVVYKDHQIIVAVFDCTNYAQLSNAVISLMHSAVAAM